MLLTLSEDAAAACLKLLLRPLLQEVDLETRHEVFSALGHYEQALGQALPVGHTVVIFLRAACGSLPPRLLLLEPGTTVEQAPLNPLDSLDLFRHCKSCGFLNNECLGRRVPLKALTKALSPSPSGWVGATGIGLFDLNKRCISYFEAIDAFLLALVTSALVLFRLSEPRMLINIILLEGWMSVAIAVHKPYASTFEILLDLLARSIVFMVAFTHLAQLAFAASQE